MNPAREFVAMPDRYPGQITWHYDRIEIIADGVVHAIGVCLGFIGAVAIVVMAVKIERINVAPILVYVIGLVTMLAFSASYNLWPVSPVKLVLRRFDHSAISLFIDRRNLHAIFGADEKRSGLGRPWHWRLVERRRRHGAKARNSRAVRSPGRYSLPAAGLERCHCLRLPCICHPQFEPMASRDRGHSLLARHAVSCLAAPALSQRDLAWFCVARGKLPLFSGPGLLASSLMTRPSRRRPSGSS